MNASCDTRNIIHEIHETENVFWTVNFYVNVNP